ncbi:MAG: lysine-2,3-aminomutase-like protein [Rhodospirillaceae bacterium]
MNVSVSKTLRTPGDLAAAGLISRADENALDAVAARYDIAVPPALIELMRSSPHAARIARQFVPSADELHTAPEERGDPIGDESHSPVKGIVHRYPDRVLLMPTLVCPVYCRFCFRREAVGASGGTLTTEEMRAALDYIRRTPSIWEVILTGGDPLILSARRVGEIISALDAMAHVRTIRVHTRMPIATPERVSDDLVGAFKRTSKSVYVAIHCNHAAELTPQVEHACGRLADAGIPLLSQTVLLKGVNDSVATLETLIRKLVTLRIKPYYLHQHDLAAGTGHFRVPLETGQALVRALRGRVSGLAQPTFMLDIPGGAGKVPLTPAYTAMSDNGQLSVEDVDGHTHAYTPPNST